MNGYPYILVLNEKHEDAMFLISSLDEFARVAAFVVLSRAKDGYDYPTFEKIEQDKNREVANLTASFSDADQELLKMDEEVISNLPEALSKVATQVHDKYREALSDILRASDVNAQFASYVRALQESDAPHEVVNKFNGRNVRTAIHVLNLRSECEYEGYETERFSAVPTIDEIRGYR